MPGKRAPHPAEIKSAEDVVLARAKAIQLKREKPGNDTPDIPDPIPEPPKVYAHWDYVGFEAAWLAKDMAAEKVWKKKAAFYFANLIASSPVRLRPVKQEERREAEEDGEQNILSVSRKSASRGQPRAGAAARTKRSSKTKRTASVKSEDDDENEEIARDDEDGSDLSRSRPPAPPSEPLLTYQFDWNWQQSVRNVIIRKDKEIMISKLVEWQEYENEYDANRQAVEDYWRETSLKRALERDGKPLYEVDVVKDLFDIGEPVGSGVTSRLDENGEYADVAPTSQPKRAPKRGRQHTDDAAYQRPVRARANGAAVLPPVRQPLGQSWDSEDDRLLCSIMSEFGENSALVADVYVSTRRLEGIHCDAAHAELRIRQIVEAQDGRSLTADFPMPKFEAREFLQQSIPCMASVVTRYQAAIQPIAEQVVRERDAEDKSVTQKRADYMLHSNRINTHVTHSRFMAEAQAAFNGVQFPRQMLDIMRGQHDPGRMRASMLQYQPQQMGLSAQPMPPAAQLQQPQQGQQQPPGAAAPQAAQGVHGIDQSAAAAYRSMQAGGPEALHSQGQSLTPQQVQALQAQAHSKLVAQYAAQGGMGGPGPGVSLPGMPAGAHAAPLPPNGAPHGARATGGAPVMSAQFQQMARPAMPGQRPGGGGNPGLPGYGMPGLGHHGLRPMQPAANDGQLGASVGMSAAYHVAGPGATHAPQVMQVAMQHMQDTLGAAPGGGGHGGMHAHNSGLPPGMQGGPRSGSAGSHSLSLPPAPS